MNAPTPQEQPDGHTKGLILSIEDEDRGFLKVATVRPVGSIRPYVFIGIFRSAQADALIRETFFDQTVRTWRVGEEEGPFAVAALEYAGEHQGEATFKIELKALRAKEQAS